MIWRVPYWPDFHSSV